jgi:uncharacterized protein (TIGR02246 family)
VTRISTAGVSNGDGENRIGSRLRLEGVTVAAAQTPEEVHRHWAESFNAGDVDALLELYEDDALFLAQPGSEPVRGKDAIRSVLEGFLASGARFEIRKTKSLATQELGVVYLKWTLKGGSGPDGAPMDLAAETTDVIRRQGDGRWLFAIDNPWGVGG